MPGQRSEEQEGHRESLLRSSLDSSAAVAGATCLSPGTQVGLEADTPLPHAVASGQVSRLEPVGSSDRLERSAEASGESGTAGWGTVLFHTTPSSLNLAAPVPAPAPARLGSRHLAATHPLSPSAQPSPIADPAPLSPGAGLAAAPAGSGSPASALPFSLPSPITALAAAPAAGADASCSPRPASVSNGPVGYGGFAPECRICLLAEPLSDLVTACHCTGSLAYAHMACLKTWVMEKRAVHCELCNTMYKEPYGSELAASIPPAPPSMPTIRRLTTPDGQPIIIMPMGVGLGPGAMGPLLQHHGGAHGGPTMVAADPRDLEPQPLCEWRYMWSYAVILLLLLFAIIYVTVISKRGRQEPWMMTLWQVLLVVLPIYLVLRVAFDLYRHRLAQQLAAANLQAITMANAAADAAAAAGHPHMGGHGAQREVIITRAGNRVLVLQRGGP